MILILILIIILNIISPGSKLKTLLMLISFISLESGCLAAIPEPQESFYPLDASVCSPWESSRPKSGHWKEPEASWRHSARRNIIKQKCSITPCKNWSVIVSQIITKSLIPFKCFQDVVVRHISHKYSKEMSQKSTSVTIPISFPKQYILWVYESSGLWENITICYTQARSSRFLYVSYSYKKFNKEVWT